MKRLKVLCVCQIGVGSSVMLRVFVDSVLNDLGVKDRSIEISDAATAGGLARESDVVICNMELERIVAKYGKPVLALKNMTSKAEIKEKFEEFLKAYNNN